MKWSNLYFLNTCPKRKIIIANKHVYRGRNFSCSPLCEWASNSCPNLKTNNIPGKSNQNVRRRPISEPPLTCENLRCRPLPLKGQELHLVVSGAWTGFSLLPSWTPLARSWAARQLCWAWMTILLEPIGRVSHMFTPMLTTSCTQLHLFHLLWTTTVLETIYRVDKNIAILH